MPDTVRVRVSMLPDPIEIPADEVEALRAQGLIVEEDTAPAKAAPKKSEVQS